MTKPSLLIMFAMLLLPACGNETAAEDAGLADSGPRDAAPGDGSVAIDSAVDIDANADMDGAVDGAVTDIDGAIGLDGANPVDGALDVDGGPTDMDGGGIDIDGGMDIDGGATACVSNRGCAADEYCMHDTGECARFGVCAPRPGSRACDGEPVAPVCGCDGTTYDNACLAAASRVSVQSEGACAVEMMCPTTPPPAECCYGAADCGGGGLGGGVGVRCLGVDCSDDPAVAGVCKGRAPRGGCWSDDDCRIGGGTCVGAVICPCGAICESPDEAGTCSGP